MARREVSLPLNDPGWRLNNLYWIIDKEGRKVKFKTNWAQDDLFKNMHYQNVVLKARQLGFTTFIDLFMLDQCVFNSNVRAGVIAHNRNDAQTIFRDKIKFPYENLPEQIRARVTAEKDTSDELLLSNNSSIRVGTSLRSGTLQLLHISEYGKMCAKYPEKAREVRTGALNTVASGQVVFIESTAEGQSGHFYEICEEAQQKRQMGDVLTPLDFKFFFYPWWKHPEYSMPYTGMVFKERIRKQFGELARQGIDLSDGQKEWYARKAGSQGEDMKREYPSTPLEAFEASVDGAFYAEALGRMDAESRIMAVPWEPTLPVITAWDLGLDDMTCVWFAQKSGLELRIFDYMEFRDVALTACATEVLRKPYRFTDHYMPHDISTRELTTAKPRREALETMGLRPIRVTPMSPVEDGINAVRNLLPKCVIDAVACSAGLKALRNYRKEWDDERGTFGIKPVHDWSSHAADAMRMLALNISGRSPQEEMQQHHQTRAEDYDPLPSYGGRQQQAASWEPF